MNARLLALLMFSLPTFALASEVSVPFHVGLSLRTGLPSSLDAELEVLPRALLAKNGIRRDGEPRFHPFATLAAGERYVVRDERGVEYVVTVASLEPSFAKLRLAPKDPHAGEPPALKARYHLMAYQIADTDPSQPSYPELRLYEDGTYRFGAAKGSWFEKEGKLALDGYYECWGVAEISKERVVFKFPRMGLPVRATFERMTEPGAAEASR